MLQEPLGQDTLRNRRRTSFHVLSTLTHAFVLLLDIWRWSYACYLTQLYQALHLSSGLARASQGKLVVLVSYGSRGRGVSFARGSPSELEVGMRTRTRSRYTFRACAVVLFQRNRNLCQTSTRACNRQLEATCYTGTFRAEVTQTWWGSVSEWGAWIRLSSAGVRLLLLSDGLLFTCGISQDWLTASIGNPTIPSESAVF